MSSILPRRERMTSRFSPTGRQERLLTLTVIAIAHADATKIGFKDFYIRPDIRVYAEPDSIKPFYHGFINDEESRTDVKVAVSFSGILYTGLPPYAVRLTSAPVDSSGGHSHTANRPTGLFLSSGGAAENTITLETGLDTIRSRYQASLFGGNERIIATMTLSSAYADTDTVVVRVPDLVLLPEGTTYDKVGGTCRHHGPRNDTLYRNCRTPDDDHWGTSRLLRIVQAVADSFAAKYPALRLQINDMSLPLGGKFAIDGSWSATADHQEHRMGTNADVTLDAFRNGQKVPLDSRQRRRLWDLILDLAGRRAGDETDRNHYHIN